MGCSQCNTCPACQSPLPETCEPLEQSPTIQRLVGEDEGSCKVTLINPVTGGLLVLTDAGLSFKDGSEDLAIPLSALQDADATFPYITVLNSDGELAKSQPTYVATEKWHLIGQDPTGLTFVEEKNIFGSGSGFLMKDIVSPFGFSWVTGTAGQVATIGTDGNPVFRDVNIVIPANAYPDRIAYQATKSAAKVLSINFSNFIVLDSSGANALGVHNTASKTLTLTTNGANGLDTGALASSTIYHVFVIYDPTAGTVAVLASLSGTTPTLPAGFTYKRRVGLFRTDAGSNIADGYDQIGNIVRFGTEASYATYQKTGGVASGFASGAITSYISTDFVSEAIFQINQIDVSSSGEMNVFIASAAGDTLPALTTQIYGGSAVTASQNNKHYANTFKAFIPIGGTSHYNVFFSGMSGGSDAIAISHIGYVLNV